MEYNFKVLTIAYDKINNFSRLAVETLNFFHYLWRLNARARAHATGNADLKGGQGATEKCKMQN